MDNNFYDTSESYSQSEIDNNFATKSYVDNKVIFRSGRVVGYCEVIKDCDTIYPEGTCITTCTETYKDSGSAWCLGNNCHCPSGTEYRSNFCVDF